MQPGQRNAIMRLYRASRSDLTAGELAQRKQLVALFKDAAERVEAEIYSTFGALGEDTWTLDSVRRIGRQQALLDQINNRLRVLGFQVQSTLQDGLLDQFKKAYVSSAYQLDSVTPESVSIKFGLMPDREILAMLNEPFLGARFSDRIGIITDRMAQNIQHELAMSMAGGESWQAAARRIRDEMGTEGQASVWRAEMVARTELARAQELANFRLHDENSDVIDKVVWVAHPTACDECKDHHGEILNNPSEYPPLHPNCVCDALAVPKSWGDLAKKDDGDFSISPMSKEEWAIDNGAADAVE